MKALLEARHEAGIFDEGYFRDAYGRAAGRNDGVDVARGFVKFLLEEER